MNYFSHPTAIIDPNAYIGDGCKIWHFSHIMSGSTLGENCSVGQNVVISPEVVLGKGCKVQNNVSVYKGVICQDYVFLGPSMVFTNVINPRAHIVRKDEYKTTKVGEGASIGANATILCGINIGKYAFIGAGAVVIRDLPDFALVVGNPSRQIGWVSKAGHKLYFNEERIAFCPEDGSSYQMDQEGRVNFVS